MPKPKGRRPKAPKQAQEKIERFMHAIVASSFRQARPHERHLVMALVFNETPEQRICEIMGRPMQEMRAVFWRELNLSRDEILARAAANIIRLANQNTDYGVALRANELLLKSRLSVWREPKAEPAPQASKRIGEMTLNEVEAEIARIEQRRRAAAAAPDQSAQPVDGKGLVH